MAASRTPPPAAHLRPGLSCTWFGPDAVQIGGSRRVGTVLRGLVPEDADLLERLRTAGPRSGARSGRRPGRGAPRAAALLRELEDAGVLSHPDPALEPPGRSAPDGLVWSALHRAPDDGAQLLAARAGCTVQVAGAGRLGSTIAAGLAAAGVGRVTVCDPFAVSAADLCPAGAAGGDEGAPRAEVAARRVTAAGGHGEWAWRLQVDPHRPPDLVVLVEHGVADAEGAALLMSADVDHLSVVVREAEVVVGPLVVPGAGPCLRCLDLHRADRDPDWPRLLAAALGLRRRAEGGLAPQPEETGSVLVAAGLAVLQVLHRLDLGREGGARQIGPGTTLEVELPLGLPAVRSWPVHPRCGCRRLPTTPSAAPGGPKARGRTARG